jgi:hypothetical protein
MNTVQTKATVKQVVQRLTVGTTFEKTDDINGTSAQGDVTATYQQLVKVFGKEHTNGDGYKVDAEWCLKFSDGTIATIYNWKNGKNYEGKNGIAKTKITDWHIGGNSKMAVTRVHEHLKVS